MSNEGVSTHPKGVLSHQMPKVVGENPFAGERYVIRQKLLTETLFYAGYTRESARAAMSTGNFSRLVAQGNDD